MQSDVTATYCITSRGLGLASCSTLGFIFLLGSSLDNRPVRIRLPPKAARDEMSRCWKEGSDKSTRSLDTHFYLCVHSLWARTLQGFLVLSHSVGGGPECSVNISSFLIFFIGSTLNTNKNASCTTLIFIHIFTLL